MFGVLGSLVKRVSSLICPPSEEEGLRAEITYERNLRMGLERDITVLWAEPRIQTLIEHVQQHLESGSTCPVCGQYAKLYRRALYAPMAAWLTWIVRAYESRGETVRCSACNGRGVVTIDCSKCEGKGYTPSGGWLYVNDGPVYQARRGGGDYSKLRYWNLIEQRPSLDGEPNRSAGWWRPTQRGIDFVHGRLRVPSHVFVFNDTIQTDVEDGGFSVTTVSITQALGKGFDYAEIMAMSPQEAEVKRRDLEAGQGPQMTLFEVMERVMSADRVLIGDPWTLRRRDWLVLPFGMWAHLKLKTESGRKRL